MTTSQIAPEALITDAEIDALNEALDVIAAVGKRGPFDSQLAAYADVASHAVFMLKNVLDSYYHRTMTYRQMHNADRPKDAS